MKREISIELDTFNLLLQCHSILDTSDRYIQTFDDSLHVILTDWLKEKLQVTS